MAFELEVWQAPIVDNEGNIQPGAQVTVFNFDDTIATIYDDLNRTPRSNPFNVGSDALARFYAEPGRYRVQAQVGSDIAVYDNVDLSQRALREDLADPESDVLIAGKTAKDVSALRSDLNAEGGASLVRGTVFTVDSLIGLLNAPQREGQQVSVKGFYDGSDVGGGLFVWNPNRPKSDHNGGTVITPEAIAAWDGTPANLSVLLDWTGTGTGAFVLSGVGGFVRPEWFGSSEGMDDETFIFSHIFNTFRSNCNIELSARRYNLKTPWDIKTIQFDNLNIKGMGSKSLIYLGEDSVGGTALKIRPDDNVSVPGRPLRRPFFTNLNFTYIGDGTALDIYTDYGVFSEVEISGLDKAGTTGLVYQGQTNVFKSLYVDHFDTNIEVSEEESAFSTTTEFYSLTSRSGGIGFRNKTESYAIAFYSPLFEENAKTACFFSNTRGLTMESPYFEGNAATGVELTGPEGEIVTVKSDIILNGNSYTNLTASPATRVCEAVNINGVWRNARNYDVGAFIFCNAINGLLINGFSGDASAEDQPIVKVVGSRYSILEGIDIRGIFTQKVPLIEVLDLWGIDRGNRGRADLSKINVWGGEQALNFLPDKAQDWDAAVSSGTGTIEDTLYLGNKAYKIGRSGLDDPEDGTGDGFGFRFDLDANPELAGKSLYFKFEVVEKTSGITSYHFYTHDGTERIQFSRPAATVATRQQVFFVSRLPQSGTATIAVRALGGGGTDYFVMSKPILAVVGDGAGRLG